MNPITYKLKKDLAREEAEYLAHLEDLTCRAWLKEGYVYKGNGEWYSKKRNLHRFKLSKPA